ncbi:MAG: hypothetical protein ACYS8I_12525, partial [Planctomycetota bacterium]
GYGPRIETTLANVTGRSVVHKFGKNPSVPAGSFAFVTILGQTGHVLSAATKVRVKAGNVADTAAGAGAREITVQGIDSSFDEITEAIATAGGSASSDSTNTFWRVHRAWVSSAGTYGGANTGAVTIEDGNPGGTDILTIAAGEGQSQDAIWTVPDGFTAYLMGITANVDAAVEADIAIYTRSSMNDAASAPFSSKRLRHYIDGLKGSYHFSPYTAMALGDSSGSGMSGRTDIWAEAQGGAGGTEVCVDMEIIVINNTTGF